MSWQARLAELVQGRVGISIRLDVGSTSVERFVRSRTEALQLASAEAYLAELERGELDDDEWTRLVAAVSNGQTAFFRDATQLELVGEIMRELSRGRRVPLAVWSAGCSTGEEVYSLAMIAHASGVEARIVGSDINAESLRFASAGRYGAWALRRMPERWRARYLRCEGDEHVVSEELVGMVSFTRHNLLDGSVVSPPDGGMWDVVLCRNVFIYFPEQATRGVLSRMADKLARDGAIFLGASEGLMADVPALTATERGGRILYRRPSSEPPPPRRLPPARVTAPTLLEIDSWPPAPPPAAGDDLYTQATLAIDAGELDRARRLLDELAESNPDHLLGRITQGNVLLAMHAFDEALARYAEAHDRAPLMAEIHYFEGVGRRKTGQLEQAAAAFRRAVFLDDAFWPAAYQHAGVLGRLGRLQRSRAELRHTLRTLSRTGGAYPFRSHVAGLRGLSESAERVAEACRRLLGAERPSMER